MPEPDHNSSTSDVTGDDACAVLEPVLAGPARGEILDWVLEGRSFGTALKRLRSGMQTHVFRTAAGPLSLRDMIFFVEHLLIFQSYHEVLLRYQDQLVFLLA